MTLGLVALVGGYLTDHSDHHQRWWANILVNGFFYFSLSLAALFFYALQYITESAWSVVIKRFFEAMMGFLPYGAAVIVIVLLAGQFHIHHLYHWMDTTLYHEFMTVEGGVSTYFDKEVAGAVKNPNYDSIIAAKGAYFSTWFFWLRTFIYLFTFLLFAKLFRKWSLQEDEIGGTEIHFKVFRRSALFMVFFAYFSSTLSWDWLMSLDPHWFSTLYGWYLFSGMWVGMIIFSHVTILWLKTKGYFEEITDSHMHDLGKWMFAISMLWSYLFFSQFMLIWYSNIPEEVTYYVSRIFTDYKVPFVTMFLINFVVPFLVLISRDTKRNPAFLLPVAVLIFIGHFTDVYLLVIPGTMFNHNVFGLFEIGLFLGFLGLFINRTLTTLSKAPLIAKNHPMLQESKDLNY
ncbi:MAG TPA: quinol:cytochrome C oxidoreductase [Flavobacteriales bacterium]|nr:quinol:cytochrome C oxidoreductase [Flavobacteriales bacterium]HIK66654.1 quinol:cytochrome C oxidoreductase [Flavobacteriales bacterium]